MFLKVISRALAVFNSKLALGSALLLAGTVQAAGIAPPPYDILNRHGVNMASGHVSPTLTDVSIGGKLGLTHTISTFTSNFVNYETSGSATQGYKEKFNGGVYKDVHHVRSDLTNFEIVRAYDDSSSTDFIINSDNTFTAYSDTRYSLKFESGKGFTLTKPDGTLVKYAATGLTSYNAFATGAPPPRIRMSEIIYPNGLTVSIQPNIPTTTGGGMGDAISSVTTNTGFQLKYIHEYNDAPVANDVPNTWIPGAGGWYLVVPKYLKAINNAVDYCPRDRNDVRHPELACPGLTKAWPTVTYSWPDGMPRAMYLAPGVFKVTDPVGRVTEYRHAPFTSFMPGVQDNPNIKEPRLVAIKAANSTTPIINYNYQTATVQAGDNGGLRPYYMAGPIARLVSSSIGSDGMGYSIGDPGQWPVQSINVNNGQKAVDRVRNNAEYGVEQIITWDKTIGFNTDRPNRIAYIMKKFGGGSITFDYDTRGNITRRTEDDLSTTASYPASCTAATAKICNQATWIKDANNNQTDYEYHTESGQVAKITYPADKNGKRAQTRYTYEQKYAWYKNAAGSFQRAATPIWLLMTEKKCQFTDAVANNGCNNDEVTTAYDYGPDAGPNNLFVRSVLVTAVGETPRRTCYSYDDYGNRIGETKPRGACN